MIRRLFPLAGAFFYVPRGTARRIGGEVHASRNGVNVSAGIRNVGAACVYLLRS